MSSFARNKGSQSFKDVDDEAAQKSTLERATQSQEELKQVLSQVEDKMLTFDVGPDNADQFHQLVQETLWGLLREGSEVIFRLSDADQRAARGQLKEQRAKYEQRMEQVRTASSVQLQNQAAELEAVAEKRIDRRVHELTDGGDAALVKAHQQVEIANAEIAELKLKAEGVESALAMAQQRLKTSDSRITTLETEAERSAEALQNLATELGSCTKMADEQLGKLKTSGIKTMKRLADKLQAAFQAGDSHTQVYHALTAFVPPQVRKYGLVLDHGVNLDSHVEALVSHLTSAHDLALQERDALASDKSALEVQCSTLESTVEGLKQEAAQAAQNRQELESQLRRSHEAHQDTQKQLSARETELKEAQQEIERLQAAANTIKRLEEANTKLQDEVSNTQAELKRTQEESRAKEDEFKAREDGLLGRLEQLTHQLQHTEQSLVASEDKCTELQANLDSAKASLAELLARLNDNDPDAQLKYWKGEAERLAEKAQLLEDSLQRAKVSLEKTMGALNMKVDENRTLEQQLSEMVKYVDDLRRQNAELNDETKRLSKMLQSTMSSLKLKVDANKELSDQLADVLRDYQQCKLDLQQFTKKLESAMTSLQTKAEKLKGLGSEKRSLEETLNSLLRNHCEMKLEMARCRAQLKKALAQLQLKTEEGMTLGEQLEAISVEQRRNIELLYSVLNPDAAKQALVRGTRVVTDQPLTELVKDMIDRYYAGQYTVEQAEREASAASDVVSRLQAKLDALEEESKEMLKEAHQAREKERSQLVKAAVASLQQLRMGLTTVMNQSAATNSMAKGKDDFSFNRIKNRWGVLSDGKFEQIVVQVEGPSSSPRPPPQQRQRRRAPLHPARPGVQTRVRLAAEAGEVMDKLPPPTPPRPIRQASLSPQEASPPIPSQIPGDEPSLLPPLRRAAVAAEEDPHKQRSRSVPAPARKKATKGGALHGGALSKALANPLTGWGGTDSDGEDFIKMGRHPKPPPDQPPLPLDPVPLRTAQVDDSFTHAPPPPPHGSFKSTCNSARF